MNIKGANGNTILSVDINQGAILKQELMKEHYITLPFTLASPTLFRIGSYVDTDFGRFILKDTYKPTRNNTNAGYDYQLRLDAWYYLFANKVVKFMPENDASETTFELTANISTHVQTVMKTVSYLGTLSSLYKYNGTTAISTSIDPDLSSEAKYIKYDSVNVIDALTQIAEAFDCEWWFVNNVLFFGKCERGNAVTFTHLSNVIMTSSGNKQPFANRIIAFGSERNLPHNYRGSESIVNGIVQKRLMLPESTCPNGYIQTDDVTSESEVVEIVRVYDYVYPKTDCEVSSVTTYTSTVENEDGTTTTVTFYRVKDGSGFDFSTDLILEGETLHIIFQSGLLNGMDFECHYNDDEEYYEVIVNENYGIQLPNDTLHPAIGDKFILTGWDATQMASTGIIEDAEEELYTEASKDLAKLRIDPNNYNCDYLADENHTVFPLGQKVELVNPAYFTTTRLSRIIGYEIKLDIPYDHPMYIVGESVAYNRLGTLERMIQQLGVNGALLNEYNTRNWQSIVNYTNLVVGGRLETIQHQLDNVQVTYFGDYAPALNNEPASTWASSEYSEHDGDMFYNRTTGKGYEFTYKNGAWGWVEIQDEDIRKALEDASNAQDTADGKRRVFVTPAGTLPTPPYDENDLWVNATYPTNSTSTDESQHKYYNDILKCITPKAEGGTASINDWTLASKYTDDSSLNAFLNGYTGTLTGIRNDITNAATAASNAQTSANNASSAAAQAQATADALDYLKQAYLADNTLIDHGLILSTIVALRDSNNNVWSGISGAYDSTKLGNGIAAWYGGGMIDKEVSAVSNAAKSLFRFDGSGYVANGNLKWDANGNVTIQGYSINATTLQVGGSNVATQAMLDNFVSKTFFNRLFTAYDANGNAIVPNDTTTAINNLKIMVGTWTEEYLSALGKNSEGGGGGGGIELSDVWQSLKTNTDDYANQKINSAHIPDLSGTYATKTWVNQQGFLTTHQTLYTLSIYGGTTKVLDFKPNANASIYIKAGGDISLTNDTTNKYITLSYTHPTNGANTTISAVSGKVLSAITVNNLGHVTSVSSKTLASADIPDLSGTYATASRATTLEGYFNSGGVAKVAAKLNTGTTTYTAWGQTYWSSGVPQSISGNMTSVGSITPSANGNALGTTSARFNIYGTAGNFSGNVSITGTLGVTGATTLSSTLSVAGGITLTTTKKIYFGDTSHYLELDSTGFHFSHGVYSDLFVSALGSNSSGGGSGTFDEEAMWAALGTTSTAKVIASSHIPNIAWSNITGKPSSFTPSAHNHSQIITEGDNRGVATTPNDYQNAIKFRGLKSNSYIGSPSNDTYSYLVGLRGWSDSSGGNTHELAFNNSGIYRRHGATTTWGNWYKLLDSGNYNSYSPSLTGAGASGTWGISISGNSASTTALKNLYNSSTRPTSANLTHIINGGVQHFKATDSMTTGKPVSDAHILHFHWDGEAYDAQMAITTAATPTIQYRTHAISGDTFVWGSWITALTSSNYSSYALPLSGGTLTGSLRVATGKGISDATGNGLLVYKPSPVWGGISSTQWGVGAGDIQGVIRSSDTDLIHYKGGSNYAILDSSNHGDYAYALYGGTDLAPTSTNTINLNELRSTGSYYVSTNTPSQYVTNKPDDTQNHAFRVWVSAPGGTSGYRRQRFQYLTEMTIYERFYKTDTSSWGSWYKVQGDLNGEYVTLTTNQTIGGTKTFGNTVVISSIADNKIIIDNTDSDTYYSHISFRQNGTEYGWLGTNGTTDLKWSSNILLHAGNYSSYALPLSGGTVTGQLYIKTENSSTIRLISANSTNYIQSGNAAFNGNADMIIGGYNATTGTNLNLQFNVVKATSVFKVKEYLTLGYGAEGIYLTGSGINWHNASDSWTKSIMSFTSTGATTINGVTTISNATAVSGVDDILFVGSDVSGSSAANKGVAIRLGMSSGYYTTKIACVYEQSNPQYLNPAIVFYTMYNTYAKGSEVERMRLSSAGNLTVSGEVTASSDERKKNIISNTKFNVKDIASARSILYEWKDRKDKIHGGSIAQDWLGKADSFLIQDNDGFYSINYGALALCSAITIAREVLKHSDEIDRLKQEVSYLKAKVAELEERRIA